MAQNKASRHSRPRQGFRQHKFFDSGTSLVIRRCGDFLRTTPNRCVCCCNFWTASVEPFFFKLKTGQGVALLGTLAISTAAAGALKVQGSHTGGIKASGFRSGVKKQNPR
eukprot:1143655-Pelagomonas_calceolata.AAC.16